MSEKTAREKAREALKEIAETFPSSIGMNGDAFNNSPEWVKMRNNHMIIAQEALAAIDAEKPAEKYCIRCGYAIPEYFHICTKCGLPADGEKPVEDAEEVAISIANLFSTYTLRNNKHVPASVEAAQL